MATIVAFIDDLPLSIDKYDPILHKNKIKCIDGHTLIAKRGTQVVHHYAHLSSEEGTCGKKKGPWHLEWQSRYDISCLEIAFGREHRADVYVNNKVLELQHSPISLSDIQDREKTYGKDMIWIFDGYNIKLEGLGFANDDNIKLHLAKLTSRSHPAFITSTQTFIDYLLEFGYLYEILSYNETTKILLYRKWSRGQFDTYYSAVCPFTNIAIRNSVLGSYSNSDNKPIFPSLKIPPSTIHKIPQTIKYKYILEDTITTQKVLNKYIQKRKLAKKVLNDIETDTVPGLSPLKKPLSDISYLGNVISFNNLVIHISANIGDYSKNKEVEEDLKEYYEAIPLSNNTAYYLEKITINKIITTNIETNKPKRGEKLQLLDI